jgi:hypothetical protein
MSMEEKVKLEVYIARPPTKKCREVVAVMEEVMRRYPDQVRLVTFERGAPWPEEPSRALKYALQKGSTIPMCYVDGKLVVGGKVPAPNEVQRAIEIAFHRKKSG